MDTIEFKKRIESLENDIRSKGLNKRSIIPPMYRTLWSLGIHIRPPIFCPFYVNTIFQGGGISILWGVSMWIIRGVHYGEDPLVYIVVSFAIGLPLGLLSAVLIYFKKRKLKLGEWTDYST